jgi:hypothetical protein
MKKILLLASALALPLLAQATDVRVDVGSVRIATPGLSITFGSRNDRGYYWDGYVWRDPGYWKKHNGPRGEKFYTGHPGVPHQGGGHCPPGQAKKGNC